LLDIEIPLLGVGGPEIGVERRGRGRTDELISLLLFGRRRRTERVRALALVRVGQRDVKDGGVEDVRLNEREAIQADGREIVVENAIPASHSRLPGAEKIVGETDARRDVVPIGVEDVRRKLGIALEQQSHRRIGKNGGLQAGAEGTLFSAGFGEVQVRLPAHCPT
jgi:hypothetical protein